MANVKNFGLIGVADNVQFGKAGPKLKQTTGTFQFRNAADAADAALTAAGITSSAGNVTLTTGNLVLSSNSGVVTLGDAGSISRAATGVYQFSGTGAVIMPAGTTAEQTAATAGAFRYNTETNRMEYADGSAWVQVASGGTAVTSVTGTANRITSTGGTTPVIDIAATYVGQASITTLGTIGTGTWQGNVVGPTYGGTGVNNGSNTITLGGNVSTGGALTTSAAFTTTGADAITIAAATGGSSVTLPTSGTLISTATIADNAVTSFSAGTTGFTPSTSTQGAVTLAGTLNAANGGTGLSAFASGSVLYASGPNTWAAAGPGATSGVQAYDADLDAIAALSTSGYIVRTGAGTVATRTITGAIGRIVVTDGAGVNSNTDIDLDTVTQGAGSNFVKITLDTFGRVTGNTAVAQGDLTGLLGTYYLPTAGGTMSGPIAMGNNLITGLASPVSGTDAANKNYVDAAAAGLTWKTAVKAASTGNLTLSGEQTVDGVALVTGDRILVKNQTTAADNGIYVVDSGSWTRATDADSPSELDGAAVFVQQGTTNADTGWVQTATIVTVGTTAQTWVQFTGSGTYSAGIGLSLSGNTFNVNLGAGIAQLPSDEVGIDLYDAANSALILTTDGSTRGSSTADALYLLLDPAGALAQTSAGLKINAASVTNAMLQNSSITFNGDTGSFNTALGGTIIVSGDSAQGVSSTASAGTIDFTVADATTASKGVAQFSSDNFAVASGVVTIKNGGVDLTTEVAGVLPPANGGTGVNNGTNTLTLAGNLATSGAFASTFTMTGATNVTFPTSGTLATVGGTVASFSGGTTGLTPNTATTGAITLGGTLVVANGGTGATSFTAGRVLLGDGTNPITEDADLAFTAASNTLTIGSATLAGTAAGDVTLTATATNADINLIPNGTGAVVIGPSGAGLIQSDTGQSLTVNGIAGLNLQAGTSGNVAISSAAGTVNVTSASGDITMTLAAGTADKVTIAGPTASQYITGLSDNDLVTKYYVDQTAGFASGDVKAVKATFSLASTGTFNIGAALPAGATILSVKANVTSADTGTGTLSVGKAGNVAAYMTTSENDTQTAGMYLAETMVTEASSEQVIGTVAGTPAGAGSVTVVVTYQIA